MYINNINSFIIIVKEYLDNINSIYPQPQDEKALNPYRSFPFKKEVNLFKERGHKFINWAEIKSAYNF